MKMVLNGTIHINHVFSSSHRYPIRGRGNILRSLEARAELLASQGLQKLAELKDGSLNKKLSTTVKIE